MHCRHALSFENREYFTGHRRGCYSGELRCEFGVLVQKLLCEETGLQCIDRLAVAIRDADISESASKALAKLVGFGIVSCRQDPESTV